MKRAITIKQELATIHTVEDLTEVFESIASLHIAKIRNRVVASKEFFAELWQTYRGLRVDPAKRLARKHVAKGRNVFVAITADSKLSGEADEQVIASLLDAYKTADNTDILVIGSRGAARVRASGAQVAGVFPLPAGDVGFSVSDILTSLTNYDKIAVFYQTYESLRLQKVARIDLISAVRALGEDVGEEGETVSSRDYIFEPGLDEIANYMESVMMGIALIQIIMESKLAQYAGRFNAMSAANRRAQKLSGTFKTAYHRAKRAESDERLKEILKVTQRARA